MKEGKIKDKYFENKTYFYTKRIKAFTLIELLISISILAILSTIAYISISSGIKTTRDSSRIASLVNIEKALSIYQLQAWKYPSPENIYSS
jgi:prepilin-type N-terminal cleavage/methylation domain-containing protein